MARKKTLEQIFCESYFGIEGWKLRTRLEKIAFKRAVTAVEAEVLRRLEESIKWAEEERLAKNGGAKKAKGKA